MNTHILEEELANYLKSTTNEVVAYLINMNQQGRKDKVGDRAKILSYLTKTYSNQLEDGSQDATYATSIDNAREKLGLNKEIKTTSLLTKIFSFFTSHK